MLGKQDSKVVVTSQQALDHLSPCSQGLSSCMASGKETYAGDVQVRKSCQTLGGHSYQVGTSWNQEQEPKVWYVLHSCLGLSTDDSQSFHQSATRGLHTGWAWSGSSR